MTDPANADVAELMRRLNDASNARDAALADLAACKKTHVEEAAAPLVITDDAEIERLTDALRKIALAPGPKTIVRRIAADALGLDIG